MERIIKAIKMRRDALNRVLSICLENRNKLKLLFLEMPGDSGKYSNPREFINLKQPKTTLMLIMRMMNISARLEIFSP